MQGNSTMANDIENRVVLLTGAAGGLGRSFALHLAALGYRLVLTDLQSCEASAEQCRHAGAPEVFAPTCDLSDGADVDRLIARVGERFDRIDALVNNAVFIPIMPYG